MKNKARTKEWYESQADLAAEMKAAQTVLEAARKWANHWITNLHDEPGEIELFNTIRNHDKGRK